MGRLIDGIWHDEWYDTASHEGRFVRDASVFRNWVTADGAPGPTGEGGFKAESGRYHLYVSYACPWAHRTLIFRQIKQLQDHIGCSVVGPLMLDQGWEISPGGDPLFGSEYLHQIYTRAKSDYTGRASVPVLWDKQRRTIVSNESAEIIRMFNSAFDAVGAGGVDYYPVALRDEIDRINETIYDAINDGVYRAGFASTQTAYEYAVTRLFDALDTLDARLDQQRYLVGDTLTEADWRLFTTLLRFDAVYFGHFKCNLRRIVDYPNLSMYLRELFQFPGVADTVRMDHIKQHYYRSHPKINPSGIVPLGPVLDLGRAHDRERLRAAAR